MAFAVLACAMRSVLFFYVACVFVWALCCGTASVPLPFFHPFITLTGAYSCSRSGRWVTEQSLFPNVARRLVRGTTHIQKILIAAIFVRNGRDEQRRRRGVGARRDVARRRVGVGDRGARGGAHVVHGVRRAFLLLHTGKRAALACTRACAASPLTVRHSLARTRFRRRRRPAAGGRRRNSYWHCWAWRRNCLTSERR